MHQAVLVHEVLEYLDLAPGKKVLDCTLGGGGHARSILEHITPGGILTGIDQDEDALKTASANLKDFKDNINLIHSNFRNLETIIAKHDEGEFDGVLFDLGLSSLQLEDSKRGFSIKNNGPLDMRMDRGQKIDAAYLVNKLSESEIKEVIKRFGEERFSGRIARAIASKRPIETTFQLAEIISRAVPGKARHGKIHPATRTFQALRIAVNKELEALDSVLNIVLKYIKRGGKICVISFHSLEDRIVKNRFRDYARQNLLRIITKKPVMAQREEVLLNPRSRSAKLRVGMKI